MPYRGLRNRARANRSTRWPLLALMIGAAAPALAIEPYTWIDAEGGTHFSDEPPAQPPPGGVEGPHRPTVREVMERDRQLERERRVAEFEAREAEAERQAAEAARLRALAPKPKIESPYSCDDARRFAAYFARTDQEFYRADKQGGFIPMNEAERLATLEEWQRAVKLLCTQDAKAGKAQGG